MSESETKSLHFKSAFVEDRWLDNVVFEVDQQGIITNITNATPETKIIESFDAVALPGMPNIHSHAFQRGFAGLSEYRTVDNDSFWTWRNLMYDFLLKLSPEDVYIIARQLYLEMVMAGYTWVGEFHYVHNDVNGNPYANSSELSDAILRAANDVGIGLCMLPVLYQRGGFKNESLSDGQKRFALNDDQFVELIEKLSTVKNHNFKLGIALHSLRAVGVESARVAIQHAPVGCPIHIHVAEQTKEIDDCLAAHNQRSVAFLLENFDVDARWCLIHSTHLDDVELAGIANSGAVVGLCPTTEANLGDGIFRAGEFLEAGGKISIGSDSHCSVDLREELRILEYGQRLLYRNRAVLGTSEKSVGRNLYELSAAGGGAAIGVNTGTIKIGNRADFTLIDTNHPSIAGAAGDAILDRLIFCNADDPVIGSVIAGHAKLLDDGQLLDLMAESQAAFRKVNLKLANQKMNG